MQAAVATTKKAKSIKCFIKVLERRREKILKLENWNIAKLEINKILLSFNPNSVFCDFFFSFFFSLEVSYFGKTVNESFEVSLNSKDSQ